MSIIFDEYQTRRLPKEERFSKVKQILEHEQDESIRWDAVWLAGEITEGMEPQHPLFSQVADLLVSVMKNDGNSIVRHEASFQIGARNMKEKMSDLVNSALYDKNDVVRHESIEALGIMRAHETKETLKAILKSPSLSDRETAAFVLKRLARLEGKGEYKVENIV